MAVRGFMLPTARRLAAVLVALACGHVTRASAAVATGQSQPQLRIVAFAPFADADVLSSDGGLEPVPVSGKQTLTATFSHAVIRLGADFGATPLPDSLNPFRFSPAVTGRVRWVTTSIARFDPDEEWPAELEVNVTLSPSLRALGSTLLLGDTPTFALRTPPLSMSAVSVASSQAMAVTNGSWDPTLAPLVPGALEVPPDGRVRLRFSSAVDVDLLATSLRITPVKLSADDAVSVQQTDLLTPIGVSLTRCRRADARCVQLTALEPLEPGTVYEVELPAGSRFHPAAGATHDRLSVKLSGLVPFTFPFLQVEPKNSYQDLRPRYRRYLLLLRHGLSADTSLEQLQSAFEIEPSLPFTLTRPTAATIMLSASFDPVSRYTLLVKPQADVRDGFGLPLQTSYSTFVTDTESTGFELPSGESYYNSPPARFHVSAALGAPAEWHAAAFGGVTCFSGTECKADEAVHALLTSVPADDLRAAIASLSNRMSPPMGTDPSAALGSLSSFPGVKGFEIRSASFGDALSSDSQLVMLTRKNGHSSHLSSLISAGRLEVVVLGVPDGSVLLWALDSATNAAAVGAHVDLYRVRNAYLASASDISLEHQGVTDGSGIMHIPAPPTRFVGPRVAVIRAANSSEMLVIPGVQLIWPAMMPQPLAALISDRGVYAEGEQVHLKGYLRMPSGDALTLLPSSATITVQVLWKGEETEVTPVTTDDEFGAFSLTLTVPEGATLGAIPIRLYLTAPEASVYGMTMVAKAEIVIADPRPPTVVLSVSAGNSVGADGVTLANASRVLPPNGTVGLNLRTATLSGVPVGGASVTLRWRLTRASRLAPCVRCPFDYSVFNSPALGGFTPPVADTTSDVAEGLSGEELLTTGTSGDLTVQWRPPADAAFEQLGDSLRLEFEWVGPTREVVSKSLVVPIALSEYSLSLSAPRHSVLPGHTFELAADIATHAALGGMPAVGFPLELFLYRLSDDLDAGDHGDQWFTNEEPHALPDPLTSCVVLAAEAGAAHSATCEMQLPAAGQFVGAVCALDEADGRTRRFCSAVRLGKSEAAWQEQPLSEYLQLAVTPELKRTSYEMGETGRIGLYNPLQSPVVALLAWGNKLGRKVLITPPLAPGKNAIEFDVGDECLGGCALSLHIAAAADADRELQVPVSPLLEIRAPMLASHSFTLDAQPSRRALRVSITPDSAVSRPGDETGFTVALSDKDGNPVAGEVCVFAVDKAMLAVRPHPLVNLAEALSPPLRGGGYEHSSSYKQLVSRAGLDHSAARLEHLLELDPWLRVQWPLRPTAISARTAGVAWVEAPIEQVLSHAQTAITAMPSRKRPEDESPPDVFDDVLYDRDGKWRFGGWEADDSSDVRANFETTPVFAPAMRVGASGSVHVPWKLPDNTGAFELRVYASTGADALFGAGAADQLVRKTVTLGASMPRIARAGDEFFGGVTVTGSPELPRDTQLKVSLELQTSDTPAVAPLELWYETSQIVSLSAGQTIDVTFPVRAAALGEATLIARVEADSANSDPALGDALQLQLSVLGVQPEVSVATSRALTATDETAVWTEGVVLPDAVDGSGLLTVEAGIGRFPVVSAIASGLLARAQVEDDRECAMKHIGLIAAVAMVAPYGNGDLLTRLQSELSSSTEALQQLTVSGLGLRYCSWAGGEHINLQLNAYALFILRKATLLGVQFQQALLDLRDLWAEALADGLESQVREALDHGQVWNDMYTLALCRLALGSGWEPSDPTVGDPLSMRVLLDDIDPLGVFGKAAVALALLLPDLPSLDVEGFRTHELPEGVAAILTLFVSQLRVTARTAYVAHTPSAAEAAGSSENALVLSAFATALRAGLDPDQAASVDKLANWVALGGDVGTDSVYAGLALAEYDVAVGNSDADVQLAVSVGGAPLVPPQHLLTHAPSPPPFNVSWDALPRPRGPLLFITTGRGEVSVAVSLRFVPAALMRAPVERGLSVRKVIRRFDSLLGAPVGPPLVAVPLGQVVTVTVELTLDDDQTNLLVEDWLPAGLEAIDPLANALDTSATAGGGGGALATGCIWWWRCVLFSRETRKDRVSFYTRYAYAGTHTLSYEAIAATRGTFGLPPTRATATLQPEVMGLSAGGFFDVHHSSDPELPLPEDPELPPPPPPPSPIEFTGDDDTVVVMAGAEVVVYFTITGADTTPHFTYVLAPDATGIGSSTMELKAISNKRLRFRMRASRDVQEPTCVPVFLAVSVDGVTYSSFSFFVWVLPPGTTRSSVQRANQSQADAANPKVAAQCRSFFPYLPPPHDPAPQNDNDDGLSTGAIVAVVIGSLLAAAAIVFIVLRTCCSDKAWRIMGAKIEIKQDHNTPKKQYATGTNTPKTPGGAGTPKTPRSKLDV